MFEDRGDVSLDPKSDLLVEVAAVEDLLDVDICDDDVWRGNGIRVRVWDRGRNWLIRLDLDQAQDEDANLAEGKVTSVIMSLTLYTSPHHSPPRSK